MEIVSSFATWLPFYFSYLISQAKTFSTMLNRSCESGHSHLIPNLRGTAFGLSPLSLVLYGFFIKLLYYRRNSFLFLVCWVFFFLITELVGFCQIIFGIHWDDRVMFFPSFYLCGILYWWIFVCWTTLSFLE